MPRYEKQLADKRHDLINRRQQLMFGSMLFSFA